MKKISISDVIDSMGLSKYTIRIYLLIGLALVFAGYSYMIISYTMPQMAEEWNLTKVQTGALSSWSLLGLLIGGLLVGVISDRIGRKKALALSIITFSVLTFPIYFVNSYVQFAVLRILGGLGFGAIIPIAITMMAENAPTKNRGFFIGSIMGFYVLGWVLAGISAIFIVPTYGWRVAFLVGGFPLIYLFILMPALLESPHWLLSKGREQEAIEVLKKIELKATGRSRDYAPGSLMVPPPPAKIGVSALFSKGFLKSTLALWTIYFMGSVVIYGVNGWLPTLLVNKGYGVAKGYSFAAVQNLLGSFGSITTGYMSDVIGRKKNSIVGWTATAIAVVIFAFVTNQWLVALFAGLVGFTMNYGLSSTQPLLAEAYPTEFRGTGVAWAQAFGRVGGFLSPIVAGYLQQIGLGFSGIFIFFAIPAVISAIVSLLFVTETKGQRMEMVSSARV